MQTLSPCPRTDEYQHLLAGSLVSADQQPLLLHLEQCPQCAETIQSLLDRDTMIEAVPVTPQLADDLPQGLMDRLLALDVNVEYSGLRELGPYRIRERLGQGGMGIVFLADDPLLERTVALKVMRPSLATNQSSRQRFLREARTAAKVKSDHVVTIFQSGEERGIAYVAMERLEGSTLGARLVGGEFTIAESLRIAREMALGLAAAHEQGLVHRDIKPENLMITKDGMIKILDMGLTKNVTNTADNLTGVMNTNAILGTLDYLSPEQALQNEVSAGSDIYSLGATLFMILTGHSPYDGVPASQKLMQHQFGKVPDILDYRSDAPPAFAAVLSKMMAKKISERYQSAAEVADALLPWASQDGQTAQISLPSRVMANPGYHSQTPTIREAASATASDVRISPLNPTVTVSIPKPEPVLSNGVPAHAVNRSKKKSNASQPEPIAATQPSAPESVIPSEIAPESPKAEPAAIPTRNKISAKKNTGNQTAIALIILGLAIIIGGIILLTQLV